MSNIPELRNQIDEQLQKREMRPAFEGLRKLWRLNPSSATAAYILNCREQFGDAIPQKHLKVAILRSFTVEPLIAFLKAEAFLHGIDLNVRVGEFNAYSQEILDPASILYSESADAVILAIQTRDIAPQLWNEASHLTAQESQALVQNVLAQLDSWFKAFRERSSAHLFVHSFERPTIAARGILDGQIEGGQVQSIDALNAGLRNLVRGFSNIAVIDYDALVSRHGREHWHDWLKWITTRMPVGNGCLQFLAKEWLRFIYAAAGQVRKVVVTDLDNTLWGGLAGEEGLAGIQLGPDYPGIAYQNLQRTLLDLQRRGIVLAINSKNNLEDAMRILEKHSEMLLRPADFVAMKINWNDKAQNMREIAAELNLGTDSLVFLDDNPVERERIRLEMPEVEVIDLPADPMQYESAVRDSVLFERLSITQEDLERTEMYRQQRGRVELEAAATSLEEFYTSLKQVVTIGPVTPENITRVAQLTRKTNQFNVTTRRYTEKQIQDFASSPDWDVCAIQVRDRFGDNGIVGVVITHTVGQIREIDTFLLSCRVIGRTVESAILSNIIAESTRDGLQHVLGRFIPTQKNAPSANVFRDHGFALDAIDGNEVCWRFELGEKAIPCPEWIDLQTVKQEVAEYAL